MDHFHGIELAIIHVEKLYYLHSDTGISIVFFITKVPESSCRLRYLAMQHLIRFRSYLAELNPITGT